MRLFIFLGYFLYVGQAWSACSTPEAQAGALDWKGDKFQYCDGTHWQDFGGAGGPTTLGHLSDVSATTVGNRFLLQFDGTQWQAVDFKSILATYGITFNDPDASCSHRGEVCADGTIYAGLSPDGNVSMYTTRCDVGQIFYDGACVGTRGKYKWDTYGTDTRVANCTSANSASAPTETSGGCVTGQANSATLASDWQSPAAVACENLDAHGHSDWYLPALNELWLLYNNGTPVYGVMLGSVYVSSSERDSNYARLLSFSTGARDNSHKNHEHLVRCVRR